MTVRVAWLPLLLAACVEDPASPAGPVAPAPAEAAPEDAFLRAERAHHVPAALLAAIADAETGVRMVRPEEEHPGRPTACGVMALKSDVLDEAAARAGVTPEAACTDRDANVLAAAALLDAWADAEPFDRDDLGAWAPLVVRWSGITLPEAQASFVHRAVYPRLARGVRLEGALLGKVDALPDWPAPPERLAVDSANVVWRPSPNFNGRGGADVDFVIVHVCEGAYDGCWSWLASSQSGVSAHYVVSEDGGEVTQLVAEADRAWHIAASYDCARNQGVRCDLTGTSSNTITVGIEHAGYSSQGSWDPDLVDRSAQLLCEIATHHNVPIDDTHILAHAQLQPWNRTDPGAAWPWADYLDAARAACGQGGSPATGFVIDSNNAANDPGRTEVTVSSAWLSSAASPGYWNTGYWRGPTEQVSDAARFRFRLDTPACLAVEAWWPAAADQGPATFLAWDPSGAELGRATVDQRVDGGRWNALGTWSFPVGWSEVLLSRWAAPGRYVAADAVRLTPSTACAPTAGGDTDVPADTDVPVDTLVEPHFETDAPADTLVAPDTDPSGDPTGDPTGDSEPGGTVDDTDVVHSDALDGADSDDGAPAALGCGCASAPAPSATSLLLLLLLRRRRR